MRNLLTILTLLFSANIFAQTPTANAGADQTIYLTSTNSVTLTGTATNRSSSTWREVSTDYSSGATITSPSNLTTTVTGLPQGVFYFELSVTSPTDVVATDTVVVRVDYDAPPANFTLMRSMRQSAWHNQEFIDTVNSRTGDTLNTLDQEVYHTISFPDGLSNEIFFDRNRKPDEWIDSQSGKFYSRVEDGYDWNNNGYGRAEMSFGSGYNFDTTKIYCMEWKGYFPQSFPSDMTVNQTVATFMQIHANSDAQHVFGTQIVNTGSGVNFVLDADGSLHTLCGVDSFVNKTHTVRVTFKEGVPAFYKVEVDGVLRYYNNTSVIGGLPRGQDYPKIATLYDYGNALVDPTNSTRGRKFSMTTEDFNIYSISDTTVTNNPPTAHAGSDQTISTSSTTLSGSGTDSDGSIVSYSWTKEVGGSATITSPNSATTTVTGLSAGDYRFRLTVTDNDGATGSDTVHVTVTAPPTISMSGSQSITVDNTSVLANGIPASGHTITAYRWTLISGSGTITSPNSSSTTVTGLGSGKNTFQCVVTQDDGQTASGTVDVTYTPVSSGIQNYFITHGKTIFINK